MKLSIFVWLIACTTLLATDYPQEFARVKKEGDEKKIELLLGEWLKSEVDKPDAFIAAANYYWHKSSGVGMSTRRAEQGDIVIADPKTGKEVGSIYATTNPQHVKTAIDYLHQALKKFPQRLDIWFGLAEIQQDSGDFDGELTTLKDICL